MIKIKDLKLRFPGRLNLFIDELSVGKGDILSVIGPNGSGKTTLLNIIALFQKADSGSIDIDGEEALNMSDKSGFRRKLSFIFSQPYLFNATVHKNIALPLRLRGIRDTRAVDAMLDLFKIGHLRLSPAKTLSQGEKYRVSLARAFVTQPKLVLLDEPFLSLDARFKESIINDLRRIIKLNEATAIFVTQDQAEALAFCDCLAVMINGKILQQANPGDVLRKPASKEVADFVGAGKE